MLGIVLLILKIIGIFLLTVLGLLILLVLFVLFIPLSYQVKGSYHNKVESIEVSGHISWLLAMTKAIFQYNYPDLKWRAYFLWFRISSEDEDTPIKEKLKKKSKPKKKKSVGKKTKKEAPQDTSIKKEVVKKEIQVEEDKLQEDKDVKEFIEKEKAKKSKSTQQKKEEKEPPKKNLSQTIRDLCDKIKEIIKKKDEILSILYDPVNQYTFKVLKRECLYLWKWSKPHVLKVKGDVGFEDPATTGQVLAVLGVLYGIYGNAISITPHFDEVVYDGEFLIKGRTMLYPFMKTLIILVLDKRVKKTYKTIKNFQF